MLAARGLRDGRVIKILQTILPPSKVVDSTVEIVITIIDSQSWSGIK